MLNTIKQLTPKNLASPRSSTLPSLYQPVLPLIPEHVAHTTSFLVMCGAKETDQPTPRDHLGSSRQPLIMVTRDSAKRFSGALLADLVPSVMSGSHELPETCPSIQCTASQSNYPYLQTLTTGVLSILEGYA